PRALRGGLLVALVACLIVAGPEAGPRLMDSVTPRLTMSASAAATQLQAWITPPAYTDLAPIFLKPEGGQVSVPAGARLVVNVTGSEAEPSLVLGVSRVKARRLDATSIQGERELSTSRARSV